MTKPVHHRPLRHARDYAQAIVDAHGDVARQREIFESCPLELRGLARELAKSAIEQMKLRVAHLEKHRNLVRAAAKRDPSPCAPSPKLSQLKKAAPAVGKQHLAELRAALDRGAAA